jgi:glycosyltransferase involved in cell wall biosynthesis
MIHPCAIIPIYNHGTEAGPVIQALLNNNLSVILIDDASDSKNAQIIDDYVKSSKKVSLVRHLVNQGKGGAVTSGFFKAHDDNYSHVLQIDADGQHDTDDIPTILKLAEKTPDAIITGVPIYDETVQNSRFYARYISHFWVWVETLSFDIRDSMCGFRLYPVRPVLDIMSKVSLGRRMDFDPEILVRLHWAGAQIITFMTKVKYIDGGLSNFRPIKDNLYVTMRHTRLVFGMLVRLPCILFRRLATRYY